MEKRLFYCITIKKHKDLETNEESFVASTVEWVVLSMVNETAVDEVEPEVYLVYILESLMSPMEAIIKAYEMVNEFRAKQGD